MSLFFFLNKKKSKLCKNKDTFVDQERQRYLGAHGQREQAHQELHQEGCAAALLPHRHFIIIKIIVITVLSSSTSFY